MELEIDFEILDLCLEAKFCIEWEFNPEYSPKEGLYSKFIWTAYLWVGSHRIDVTDDLSDADTKFIEQQLEETCCE